MSPEHEDGRRVETLEGRRTSDRHMSDILRSQGEDCTHGYQKKKNRAEERVRYDALIRRARETSDYESRAMMMRLEMEDDIKP